VRFGRLEAEWNAAITQHSGATLHPVRGSLFSAAYPVRRSNNVPRPRTRGIFLPREAGFGGSEEPTSRGSCFSQRNRRDELSGDGSRDVWRQRQRPHFCHGLSGQEKTAITKEEFPKPPELFNGEGVADHPAGFNYWKVQNVIRPTGMSGFGGSLKQRADMPGHRPGYAMRRPLAH
jgi:hypothetical protein